MVGRELIFLSGGGMQRGIAYDWLLTRGSAILHDVDDFKFLFGHNEWCYQLDLNVYEGSGGIL